MFTSLLHFMFYTLTYTLQLHFFVDTSTFTFMLLFVVTPTHGWEISH